MAIKVSEYKNIFKQKPSRGKGDEIQLSERDEEVLDKVWEKAAKKEEKKKIAAF